MSGFDVGKGGWRGGSLARQVGASSERGNERFYVGTLDDPLVLLGQLKDKTGADEYGLWIKAGASYIAGYRLFEAIVDPGGLGDYTTISAALTAGKKRLFLRNGIHVLSASLTVSSNDVVLAGESKEGVIIQSGASEGASSYQLILSGDRISIMNLTKSGVSSASVWPVEVTGNNCTFSDFVLKNSVSGNRGIYAHTGSGFKIQNSRIEASLYPVYTTQNQSSVNDLFLDVVNGNNTGVYLGGDGGSFSRNRYTRAGTGQYGVHIVGTNWGINENFLYSSSTAGGLAIHVAGNKNKVAGNRIEGFYNGIDNVADYGVTIINNSIVNVGNNGIDLNCTTGTGKGHHITSNNTVYSCGGNGVAIKYGKGHIVTNNTVYDATYDGFYADTTQDFSECIISNNSAYYCNNGFVGVKGTHAHNYCIWSGNLAIGSTARGFELDVADCNIIGNVGYNNGTANSITNGGGGNTQYNI